jgi:hypothetical protein
MQLRGTIYRDLSRIVREFQVEAEDDIWTLFTPILGQKESLLQWNGATFRPGSTERHKDDIAEAHLVILDKDCGDLGEYDDCYRHLTSQGRAFFMYTTHSHKIPDKRHNGTGLVGCYDCFRVVLPVSRPIQPSEFSSLVKAVMAHVVLPDPSSYLKEAETITKASGKKAKPRGWDPAASSINQFWYGPGCPPEREDDIRWDLHEGVALDVDALLAKVPAGKFSKRRKVEKLEGVANSKIGKAFDKVARALEAAGCPLDSEELGIECRSQCPLCHAGKDSLCVKADENMVLLKCFASCETLDILKLLKLSFSDLSGGQVEAEERSIQRAFNSDRTEPYTKAELSGMAPCDERWILQTSSGYFLRAPNGDYVGPVIRDHVVNKARDVLAPAISAGVLLSKLSTKGGAIDKTLGELMREYGQTPTNVQYSYCAGKSRLDGDIFIQKTGLPEEFKPEFNKNIDAWLRLFAGGNVERLLDWLATVLDLSRPTCAVCVAGASGAGKDLFVEGLARFWGGRSTSFQRAISRFNDSLLMSPLVVANEQLVGTGDYQWNPVEALKTMVSDTSRTIESKNVRSSSLDGALRLILATNKRGALDLGRQPTQSDLVALDERILLLKPTQEATNFLISIGGMDATVEWVRGGGIARHVCWLRANRNVKYGTRFIVQGQGGISDLLSAESKGSATVLRALLRALCGRQKDERVCCVRGTDVWFSRANLIEKWSIFEKSEIPEDLGEILRSISGDDRKNIWTQNKSLKMRQIQLSILEIAAEREGMLEDLERSFGLEDDEELRN